VNRVLVTAIACAGLALLGGCAAHVSRPAPAAVTTAVPATTASVAPVPPVTVTVPAPMTATVPAPAPAPQVVPPGRTPCQWLGANGYSYEVVYLMWVDHGSPPNWDADGDGYPCEQTYGDQN
jgi:hypothetical protein